jgi:hypothetical protein
MTKHAIALLTALALTAAAAPAQATPSTQIWIPSTDIQGFGVLHLNYDVYARPSKVPLLVLGPTIGVLPFDKIQVEAGFDLMFQGVEALDKYPIYFHAKVGTPEDSLFKWSPAIAVGIYNVGIKPGVTMQNVGYAELARTIPIIGRLSLGYYYGNAAILRTPIGGDLTLGTEPDNHGFLASWDRVMKEITDKLWLCVDYQQGQNILGAINAGLAWSFTKDISVIVAYDHYWNEAMAGKDTFTVQLDINLFSPPDAPPAPPAAEPAAGAADKPSAPAAAPAASPADKATDNSPDKPAVP